MSGDEQYSPKSPGIASDVTTTSRTPPRKATNPNMDETPKRGKATNYNDRLKFEYGNETNVGKLQERVYYLEGELEKANSFANDIQTKLYETNLVLEATEKANRGTKDNLHIVKLENVIEERNEQIGHIKEQIDKTIADMSDIAEENERLKDELDQTKMDAETEQQGLIQKINELEAQQDADKQTILKLKLHYENKEEMVAIITTREEKLKGRLATQEQQLKSYQAELEQAKTTQESLNASNVRLLEHQSIKDTQIEKLTKEIEDHIDQLQKKETEMEEQAQRHQSQVSIYEGSLKKLELSLKESQARLMFQQLVEGDQSDMLEQSDASYHVEDANTNNKTMSVLHANLQKTIGQKYALKRRNENLDRELEGMKSQLMYQKEQMTVRDKRIRELDSKYTASQHALGLVNNEIEALRATMEAKTQSYNAQLVAMAQLKEQLKDVQADAAEFAKQLAEKRNRDMNKKNDAVTKQKLVPSKPDKKLLKTLQEDQYMLNRVEKFRSRMNYPDDLHILLDDIAERIKMYIPNTNKLVNRITKQQLDTELLEAKHTDIEERVESLKDENALLKAKLTTLQEKPNELIKSLHQELESKDLELRQLTNVIQGNNQEIIKMDQKLMITAKENDDLKTKSSNLDAKLEQKDVELIYKVEQAEKEAYLQSKDLDQHLRSYFEHRLREIGFNERTETLERFTDELYALKLVEKDLMIENTKQQTIISNLQARLQSQKHLIQQLEKNISSMPSTAYENPVNIGKAYQNELKRLEKELTDKSKLVSSMEQDTDAATLKLKIAQLKNTKEEAESQLGLLSDKYDELDAALVKAKKQHRQTLVKLTASEVKITELQGDVKEKQDQIDKMTEYTGKGTKKQKLSKKLSESYKRESALNRQLQTAHERELEIRSKLEKRDAAIQSFKNLSHQIEQGKKVSSSRFTSIMKKAIDSNTTQSMTERVIAYEAEVNTLQKQLLGLQTENKTLHKTIEAGDPNLVKVESELKSREDELKTLKDTEDELTKKVESLEDQINDYRQQLLNVEKDKTDQQTELVSNLHKLTEAYNQLEKQFKQQKSQFSQTSQERDSSIMKIKEQSAAIQALNTQLASMQKTRSILEEELHKRKDDFEATQLMQEQSHSKTLLNLKEEQKNTSQLHSLASKLKSENDSVISENRSLKEAAKNLVRLKEEFTKLRHAKEILEEQHRHAKEHIENLMADRLEVQKGHRESLKQLREENENNIAEKDTQIDELNTKMDVLKQKMHEATLSGKENEQKLISRLGSYEQHYKNQLAKEKEEMLKEQLEIQKNVATIEQEKVKVEQQVETLKGQNERLENIIVEEKKQSLDQMKRIESDFGKYRDTQAEVVNGFEEQINTLNDKLHAKSELEQQNETLQSKIEELNTRINEGNDHVASLQSTIKNLKHKLKSLRTDQATDAKQHQMVLSQVKRKLKETQEALDEKDAQIESKLRRAEKDNTRDRSRLTSHLGQLRQKEKVYQEQITSYESVIRDLEEKTKRHEENENRKDRLCNDYKSRNQQLKESARHHDKKISEQSNKIRVLSDTKQRLESIISNQKEMIKNQTEHLEKLKLELEKKRREKKETSAKLSTTKTKLERVKRSEEVRDTHNQVQIQSLKELLTVLCDHQLGVIQQLENDLHTIAVHQQQFSSQSVQLNSTDDVLSSLINHSTSSDSQSSNESQDGTEEVMNEALSMMGLTIEDVQDIVQSTMNDPSSNEKPLLPPMVTAKRTLEKSLDVRRACQTIQRLLSSAESIPLVALREQFNFIEATRVSLERVVAVAQQQQFFASKAHPHPNDDRLRSEIEKLKKREEVYEKTFADLGSKLNEMMSTQPISAS